MWMLSDRIHSKYKMESLDMVQFSCAATKWLLAASSAWTHSRKERAQGKKEGQKHTKVYSTYQQSGNPTGSGIRRLAARTDERELKGNIAEESVLSLAVNLGRFTGDYIRDLILLDGKMAGRESEVSSISFYWPKVLGWCVVIFQ